MYCMLPPANNHDLPYYLIFLFCFQYRSSWETIFSKSSEAITGLEMACCRRVVELCQDCLLIVYQFASDTKTNNNGGYSEGRSHHR